MFFFFCFHHHLIITESDSDSVELILDPLTSLDVTSTELWTKKQSYWRKTCCHVGGTHLFQVINEFLSFFLKNLVFVGFGNGLTDKQSLVFGTAFTRNHLAATVYCQALMSLSCQRLPNGELTDFNWCATKTTTSCGKNLILHTALSVLAYRCRYAACTQCTYLMFYGMWLLCVCWTVINNHMRLLNVIISKPSYGLTTHKAIT